MQGMPVEEGRIVPRNDWDRAPWNRWAFQNVRQILPTVEVWRGDGPVLHIPRDEFDIAGVSFNQFDGSSSTIGDWLASDFTDGFVVVIDGTIRYEHYDNGMTPRSLHLSQSVAKSVVGTVAGILCDQGVVSRAAKITDYLPELSSTAYADATLANVLDMTSGVAFNEAYEDPGSDIAMTDFACGWKIPPPGVEAPRSMWEQILGLTDKAREHGERFIYRSIETDVLAFCLERASGTRLAELVSRELWSKLGVEESACFTVDRSGYALADGGFNACLRDYARLGLLHLNNGVAGDERILSKDWCESTRDGDHNRFGEPHNTVLTDGAYRNTFWIRDHRQPVTMAIGVFGQMIYIDPACNMVVVKLSTWPEFVSDERKTNTLAAIDAIASHLTS